MQVLKVDSEITVLYKIIITIFYNYQNTPSFVAPLYTFLCVLNKHHCSRFHTAPGEFREEICVPLCRLISSLGNLRFTLLCHAFKCPSPLLHNVVKSCGSSPTRATSIFLGYTYIHGKTCLLHHLLFKTCMWHRKGWGAKKWGLVVLRRSQLDFLCWPHQVLFYLLFHFCLAKEADGPNFKPKLLVRVPKVSQHDIDDGNLIDFGSINLHHSLSVALPCRASV